MPPHAAPHKHAAALLQAAPTPTPPRPKNVPGLPDAADADAAISDYNQLKARLGALQRPSALKSWSQVRGFAAVPRVRAHAYPHACQ